MTGCFHLWVYFEHSFVPGTGWGARTAEMENIVSDLKDCVL